MDSKRDEASHPIATRVLISAAKTMNSFIDRIFGLSLFLCVMVMGVLMVLPVIGIGYEPQFHQNGWHSCTRKDIERCSLNAAIMQL